MVLDSDIELPAVLSGHINDARQYPRYCLEYKATQYTEIYIVVIKCEVSRAWMCSFSRIPSVTVLRVLKRQPPRASTRAWRANILRQIVAGPRIRHPEAKLDLCYVTDNIIATSGPSATYPSRAYRNPLDELVSFLDSKHGEDWCIWEFRAEGTGYPDSEVYGRIHHFPFPDHHPPPFALIPAIVGSMRNWIHRLDEDRKGEEQHPQHDHRQKRHGSHGTKKKRVAVVHCKAGKGRSGTIACSYLISQEGWKKEDALQRFTQRRMRAGFGAGVSIPSQVRWVGYVDRWANRMGKNYVERPVEILELHVWGLRDGVKVAVEGYVDEGKKIKCFHLFRRGERTVVDDGKFPPMAAHHRKHLATDSPSSSSSAIISSRSGAGSLDQSNDSGHSGTTKVTDSQRIPALILKPSKPVIVPTSDVNIDFERRSKAAYTGWAMVTSVAHVWFNAYFEGGDKHDSGVFEVDWEEMDGIKGSVRKGIRALDRLKVVWRYASAADLGIELEAKEELAPPLGKVISEPKPGEPVPESRPADWRGDDPTAADGPLRNQENIPHRMVEDHITQEPKGLTSRTNHPVITGVTTAAAAAIGTTAHSLHGLGKELGLRRQTVESRDVSLANSSVEDLGRDDGPVPAKADEAAPQNGNGDLECVRPYFGSNNGDDHAAGEDTTIKPSTRT